MITCEQSKAIVNKGFFNSTVAERLAFKTHYDKCESCRKLLKDHTKPIRDKMSPEQLLELESIAQSILASDLQDPEGV